MRGDIEVRDAGRKGKGVFALRSFRRGEFIFRRRHGRVVSNSDIASLSEDERQHLCELDYDTSAVLLPPGCYLNHSCEPNAMRSGVKVFAWRQIRAGEEITIDYRLNAFGGERWDCACGSASCSGSIVGDFFSLDARRQRSYLPYAPAFIQREYRHRGRAAGAPTRPRPVTAPAGHRPWQVIKAIEGEGGRGLRLLPRERQVLRLRADGRSLAEVAAALGVTRERVRQIAHQAERKLRVAPGRGGTGR